jgi:exosortase B
MSSAALSPLPISSLLRQNILFLVGLFALLIPSYIELFDMIGDATDFAHAPIALAVIAWVGWQNRAVLWQPVVSPMPTTGWSLFTIGLLAYWLGRSQDILLLEIGSHMPILAGLLLALKGRQALAAMALPLVFMFFLIPLPAPLLEALTNPLKQQVSMVVEHVLYAAGYPIARSGVILTIGQYQLLVADACSGLKSMYSLTAIGILYIYLRGHAHFWHNLVLLSLLIPIAFVTNVLRVISLVLVTYYLGEESGLGYLHDFAAISEFLIALALLFCSDSILGMMFRYRHSSENKG